jgi:hypothetical protein
MRVQNKGTEKGIGIGWNANWKTLHKKAEMNG